MNQKTKKSTQNREYGVFANLRNPEKPHTPYWAIASGRLWEFAATSLKIERLRRSLESELKTIPKLVISMVRSQGWKFLAIVNLKSKGGFLNLPKPRKLYCIRGLGRFCRVAITLAKIEKLVRSPSPTEIIIGVLFLVGSDRSQKIKVKSELKSSPLNNLSPWMVFRGEQFIANDENLHNPCWKGAWLKLCEFRCKPPKLKRSLFCELKRIPVTGIFGGWEVAA
ncbi:hypothetical protein H6G96_37760 [Nostoc sp. FACHB-892]|uniref:hypothetical protein n=1 Tax=Nostoc sp. FACHB-892 TaxID=2692843 RepID=UPI001685F017|nr:hypothetical protein [Nostoc sp. FACHB-892]MBD2731866.1 hypothetical protein [Nostoc sp. FACHB-892]